MMADRYFVEVDGEDLSESGLHKLNGLLALHNIKGESVTGVVLEVKLFSVDLIQFDDNGNPKIEYKPATDGWEVPAVPVIVTERVEVGSRPGKKSHIHPDQATVDDYVDPAVVETPND